VLSFAGWAGYSPRSFGRALEMWAPEPPNTCDVPWDHTDSITLPVFCDAAALRDRIRALNVAGKEAGVEALEIFSTSVRPTEFNRGVRRYGNKSVVLFLQTATMLREMWRRWGKEGLLVFADKHGGRKRYAPLLGRVFPTARIRFRQETHQVSTYTIYENDREMTLSFVIKADDKYLPVALASMASKYVRELDMKLFNAFWAQHVEGLRPTAGYPQDAKRFLDQIEGARRRLEIDKDIFVRIR